MLFADSLPCQPSATTMPQMVVRGEVRKAQLTIESMFQASEQIDAAARVSGEVLRRPATRQRSGRPVINITVAGTPGNWPRPGIG